MEFPSREFDDAVAAICSGTLTDADALEFRTILAGSERALDEYLWQVELHAFLASRKVARVVDEEVVSLENPRPSLDKGRRPTRSVRVMRTGVAAVVLGSIAGAAWWTAGSGHEPGGSANSALSHPLSFHEQDFDGQRKAAGAPAALMGYYEENISFVAASDAPVIAGTGQKDSIELGAQISYSQSGHTLHVWDWSKSSRSRVLKNTRLWPRPSRTHGGSRNFAISPDGKCLVRASGEVTDLNSEARSEIDLGGEFFSANAGGRLVRIHGMQFTPDGRRLALLLSNLKVAASEHPLRKQDLVATHSIQLVDFPTAKLVCEFPAGFPCAFSQDGKRVVTGSPPGELDQQIVERDAETGEVIRRYEPRVQGFAYTLCWSPDGSRLAAYDGEVGEVLVWETSTGELAYRVNAGKHQYPMRFSPDGQHLAIGLEQVVRLLPAVMVVNASNGEVEATATFTSHYPNLIHWEADSKAFHVLSYVTGRGYADGVNEKGERILNNLYPCVERVDFQALQKK